MQKVCKAPAGRAARNVLDPPERSLQLLGPIPRKVEICAGYAAGIGRAKDRALFAVMPSPCVCQSSMEHGVSTDAGAKL